MNRHKIIFGTILLLLLLLIQASFAQEGEEQIEFEIKSERAAEDYSLLRDSTDLDWNLALKYIALDKNRNAYLSIGGSYRLRFEHVGNQNWTPDNDENYYSQRLSFHTDLHLGKNVRFFGELQHGYRTEEEEFLQSDVVDMHQGFVELTTSNPDNRLKLRLGRQEMKLGSGRLVDLRVGTNIRRSFDMGRLAYESENLNIDAFYGNEVGIEFEAFDNRSELFEESSPNPQLWGIYSEFHFKEKRIQGEGNELYYLGFQSNISAFSDVIGKETRHTIGLRRFGTLAKRFRYNTELIYQFGDLGDNSISAFNFETDWKYTFIKAKWRPTIGIKLDWSSGDNEINDGKLNSFNPMFVNPATYSLAAVNTPINLLSFHPSITLFPAKEWFINIDYAIFYRASTDDGLYSPPRFQSRTAGGITDQHIGNTIGLYIEYNHSEHVVFDIRSSYFRAGNFLEASGSSETIFQFAPTLKFQF